jgi:EAL domain-containing protein (putative c-di-GMP-specific phosphodiesterase class I)
VLTESAAMDDGLRAIEILARLRLRGFELSIDDFGTGYSSLVQLHRLPFCELKIDRMFIADCASSRNGLVFVRTMIDLAHNVGLRAGAEGVESGAVVKLLKELGCDRLQGYHFARPMPAKDVAAWSARFAAEPERDQEGVGKP